MGQEWEFTKMKIDRIQGMHVSDYIGKKQRVMSSFEIGEKFKNRWNIFDFWIPFYFLEDHL